MPIIFTALRIFLCLTFLSLIFTGDATAQKRRKSVKKKSVPEKAVLLGSGTIGTVEREPYLSLEPCAKETSEQIAEIENAADKNEQVSILVKRIESKDDWLRACSIYRLGEFRNAAQTALPLIISLVRDEKNDDVWTHVQDAMWKIPPDRNIPLAERLRMAHDRNVYQRLYAVYSLGYFRPVAKSKQTEEILKTLLETTKDEDRTVKWLSVMCIRQLGFYGVDTSAAIPVFSELLKNNELNPVNVVRAIVPMGENALPAVPLLFDILFNPQKYIGKKDDRDKSYMLYLTAAIALGKIGKPILPLLEKEVEKHPYAVLQVLSNLTAEGVLPILYRAMKHPTPEVRKKAIESFPGLTSIGAIEALPHLLQAVNDKNSDVRQSAMSKLGSIGKYTENKSLQLRELIIKKAVPALMTKLSSEEDNCYASMMLGDFGNDAEAAIPRLVDMIKKNQAVSCVESGLYHIGEKGKKFLTEEKIKEIEERERNFLDFDLNKAKPIKPKEEPKASPVTVEKET